MLNRQEWALLGITVIWGLTFLLVRNVLSVSGPFFFVGLRFAVAALILLPLSIRFISAITRTELIAGTMIGIFLFGGFVLQTCGLQYISASKSGFITAFYVPAVPLAQWLLMRRAPRLSAWAGIASAFIGLLLLSGPDNISPGFGKGELLTFMGALVFAFEIVLISFFAGKINVRLVCLIQVTVTSLLSFLLMPLVGESTPDFSLLLVLSALSLGAITALAQFVMNWAQRTVSPVRATIIYAGEPIWAGIFGRMAGERLPAIALLGGLFVALGVLVSSLKLKSK